MTTDIVTPFLLAFITILSSTILSPVPVHGQSGQSGYVPHNMSSAVPGIDVNSTITTAIAQASVAASMSSGPAVISGRPSGTGTGGGGSRNRSQESVGSGSTGGVNLQEAFSGVSVLPSDPELPIFGVLNYTGPGSNSTIGTYDRYVISHHLNGASCVQNVHRYMHM